jgi:small subunit ribosomal protein S12
MPTINQLTRLLPRKKKKHYNISKKLRGRPQLKAVCLKVYTTSPKKPNSAVRKVAKVRLSTGQKTIVYIPGQGHSLQEHSTVMIRGGRVPDLPGVHYHIIRGLEDFKTKESFDRRKRRSKFGVPFPEDLKVKHYN